MDRSDDGAETSPEQDSPRSAEGTDRPARSGTTPTMFSQETDVWEEMRRAERKRIAVWGLATGGVMAAVVALCLLLAYLASSS